MPPSHRERSRPPGVAQRFRRDAAEARANDEGSLLLHFLHEGNGWKNRVEAYRQYLVVQLARDTAGIMAGHGLF